MSGEVLVQAGRYQPETNNLEVKEVREGARGAMLSPVSLQKSHPGRSGPGGFSGEADAEGGEARF